MAGNAPEAPVPEGLEGHLVSRCGVLCDTCPAYRQGTCPGCPNLGPGECVIRDCADRLAGGRCWECTQVSCYHFEALAARRQAMQMLMRRRRLLLAQEGPSTAGLAHAAAGVAGTGQSRSQGGSPGCPACSVCPLRRSTRTGACLP